MVYPLVIAYYQCVIGCGIVYCKVESLRRKGVVLAGFERQWFVFQRQSVGNVLGGCMVAVCHNV